MDGESVLDELLGTVAATLDDHAAERVDRLGSEADVAHDRDAGVDDGADGVSAFYAALKLDRGDAGFLHQAHGVAHGVDVGGLVAAEGHVRDDEGALGGIGHGAGHGDHLVDGQRDGGVAAVDDVGGGVADEQNVDAGVVEDAGGHHVIGRQGGNLLAVALGCLEVARAHAGDGGQIHAWKHNQ